jgi:hypothetical protein
VKARVGSVVLRDRARLGERARLSHWPKPRRRRAPTAATSIATTALRADSWRNRPASTARPRRIERIQSP